jgi:hypothetical protein
MASFGLVKGSRIKEQRRVLDQASRQRRARKNLESLEQDNFHDDPHADLVMSKKALSLFQDHGGDHGGAHGSKVNKDKNRKKSRNAEYYKQRLDFLSYSNVAEEEIATERREFIILRIGDKKLQFSHL